MPSQHFIVVFEPVGKPGEQLEAEVITPASSETVWTPALMGQAFMNTSKVDKTLLPKGVSIRRVLWVREKVLN